MHDMSVQVEYSNQPRFAPEIEPLRIGPVVVDPPVLQAPMAGFTNYAFRQIVRDFGGAGLLATEMVVRRGFAWLDEHDLEHPDRLWGVPGRAAAAGGADLGQRSGHAGRSGRRLAHEFRVSVVDINFGCPVRDVTEKAQSGSYLLRYPDADRRDRRAGRRRPVRRRR